MAKRKVTPARMMNRSPGNPPAISSTFSSNAPSRTNIPTMKAAAMPSAPMWIGSRVATRKIAQRTRMETNSMDMGTHSVPSKRRNEFRLAEV
jgi:hypothetical protein